MNSSCDLANDWNRGMRYINPTTFFFEELEQTWEKERTRGHCPRKFLRIAELF